MLRPWWGRWAQLSVAAATAVLYLSNLSVNGLGNPYYAAAVKSGSVSWKAFLFGSLDPGSFITVDKPPAAFWVQALSVRVFGYSSWSLLVPQALAGVAGAAIVYHLARRLVLARASARPTGAAGVDALGTVGTASAEVAGVLAGLALAVTPIAAVMFRFNDPDALLTLLLVLATWAGWVAIERGTIRHLVMAGFFVGLAFLAKELVAAVVVPGLALAWTIAAPVSLRRRLLGWLWSGLALIVSAGWWVALVELWPASDRPYIGSSTNNSIISVIFGYNGFSRLFGSHGGGSRAVARVGGAATRAPDGAFGAFGGGRSGAGGLSFGAGAGWTRTFTDTLGSQISWLIPLAALGLVFGLLSAGRAPRQDLRRAGYILWGSWAVAAWAVFSKSSGTFHPYYVVALAPPVALLAATGAVDLWMAGRRHRALCWLLPAGIAGSGLWAYALLDRDASYHPWLRTAVLVGALAAAVGLLAAALLQPTTRTADPTAAAAASAGAAGPDDAPARRGGRIGRRVAPAAGVVAALALLAGPAAWSISSVTHASNGTNPTAGPSSATTSDLSFGVGGRSGRSGAAPLGLGGGVGGFGEGRPGEGGGGFGGRGFGGGAFGSTAGGLAAGFGGAASTGPTAGDKTFVSWLEGHRAGARYLVAVDGSMTADNLIIASGKPVMAMGGFSGRDPDPTVGQFERLVSANEVRYVLIGGGGGGGGAGGFGGFGGRGGAGGGGSTVAAVEQWVMAHGMVVPASSWGGTVSGTLYEVTPATVSASTSSTQASISAST